MQRRKAGGFTLVEVLVALVVMAVMATMAWQGIDGIVRARAASEGQVDRMLRLSTVLEQWEQDLASVEDTDLVPALAFDGSTLRLTRRSEAGVQVVAWSLHDGRWLRWLSAPVVTSRALQDSWLRSLQLNGREAEQLRAVEGVLQWQVYFYRGNAWTNAQSSADVQAPVAPAAAASEPTGTAGPGGSAAGTAVQRVLLPSGVRLVLDFGEGSGFGGSLTRDLRLGPQVQ